MADVLKNVHYCKQPTQTYVDCFNIINNMMTASYSFSWKDRPLQRIWKVF